MPNFFKRAWNDIFVERKNIESYIVLAAIVMVIFADIVGVDTAEILQEVVLAVLGVFIYISIEQRHDMEQLEAVNKDTQAKLQHINNQILEVPNLLVENTQSAKLLLPPELPQYRTVSPDAETIDVLTWSGYGLFTTYDDYFYDRLESGCQIRWIALDPECEGTNIILEHSRLKSVKTGIQQMINHHKGVHARFDKAINFELRLTSWLLPMSLTIFDREKPHAYMVIGLYNPYLGISQNERRHLIIYKRSQPRDFTAYLKQFELHWNNTEFTKPVDI